MQIEQQEKSKISNLISKLKNTKILNTLSKNKMRIGTLVKNKT